MPQLGVNIDHVATLRQARREFVPDPVAAALICEKAGAESIVAHLREDRRHVQDRDITQLRRIIKTRFNLEMSLEPSIIKTAQELRPDQATLVPEKREEITTEGGLDVSKNSSRIEKAFRVLQKQGIVVSLFIAPVKKQIRLTHKMGIPMIELHTGQYARAHSIKERKTLLKRLSEMTAYAQSLGIIVNAGHGLNYQNTPAVAKIPGIEELNIGHSIISRAVFVGLHRAVEEMVRLIKD